MLPPSFFLLTTMAICSLLQLHFGSTAAERLASKKSTPPTMDPAAWSQFQTAGASLGSSDFRYCTDSHLCECSQRSVSCKRLEINSTEFNRLQRWSASASSYLLQQLTVYRSNLTKLEAFSFTELRSLQRLSLRFNAIRIIHPDALRGLFQLKTLDFRQNSLSYLAPDVFTDLVQLEELDLSENNINSIDANTLRPLLRLRKLSLASNDFKTIYAMQHLPRLASLEVLSLADNDLSELTGETFSTTLPELRRLDVSSNRIQFLATNTLVNMPLLESVDIYSNALSYIDPVAFQTLRNINEVLFGDNPLVCDCKLQPLRRFYQQLVSENPSMLVEKQLLPPSVFSRRAETVSCERTHTCSPICKSPFYVKGHAFYDLSPAELACPTTTTTTTTTTPAPAKKAKNYLALFGTGGNVQRLDGALIPGGLVNNNYQNNNNNRNEANRRGAMPTKAGFDESLAIAIGIVSSVVLLALLVIGTLCFRQHFARRPHRRSKNISVLSTGHLAGGQSSSSSSNSDEGGDNPTTSSSSHSSSPGIHQTLPQAKQLSLSVTSGLSGRFQLPSSISYDAWGPSLPVRQPVLGSLARKSSDYAAIYPPPSFNASAMPIGAEPPGFTDASRQSDGLLLQTVLQTPNSRTILSSSNDLRTFSAVPRSESLV